MFKNLSNMTSMLRQAREMAGNLESQQQQLRSETVSANAGGGMVEVEANGLGEITRIRLEPSLVEGGDREMIEDLTLAAVNQAIVKAKQLNMQSIQELAGGMPGLQDALASLTGGGPPTE